MRLLITRIDDSGKQTIGRMYALDENDASVKDYPTLELPWEDNETNVSCIPVGEYQVIKRWSPKFDNHFHILDVEGRSYILIHKGNYYTDIRGCILIGKDLSDINKDGELDVTSSAVAMSELLEIMPERFTLTILKQ